MRRLVALGASLLLLAGMTGASAGPTAGGIATDNVEYVGFVPFDQTSSTGVTVVGKHAYLTSWKNLSIYDVSDPTAPELLGYEPLGFKFENENVATDGKILLFSEELPLDTLHVYDVEDKSNPTLIAQVEGAGDHTTTCILKCNWAYGSDGHITDLRNPKKPKLQKLNWHEAVGLQARAHDVEEYRNGFVVVSTLETPLMILDVRDPLDPKLLATGKHPHPWGEGGFLFHSGRWPNGGRDRFLLMQGEDNFNARCNENNGPFMTFSTKGWQKTHSVKLVDSFRVQNGVYADGSPAANGLGCSAHWFEEHATFDNGGLVAVGYYEHGTRFLDVAPTGKIKEAGYFMPYGGSTSAAYWLSKNIVWAVDYTRGIDILRWKGKV
jgi:hypothetical protein